ncbi:hypothetical protein HOM13_00655 [Candidatus Woesearchaeota archaeon]|jgi:hypothetical protein|nr:hypothetical protein [Candidatus Woesearchaeota archaeon]
MVLGKRKGYSFLKSKATFQIYLIVLFSLSLFFINIELTSAQEVGCCENDGQGSYCLPTTQENCNGGSWDPVSCEFTSYCSTGCCINGLDGSCGNNVPQAACENSQNTAFHDGASCETISYCERGCCELGSSFVFNTEQSCQRLIDEYYPSLNIETAWDSGITDEYTCITQSIQDDEGCCVESDGIFNSCGWSTRGTCTTNGEETNQENSEGFYKDVFCSNPNLECSSCVAQSYKACDGNSNEDVYWFDSCGNREDLVDDCDPIGINGPGSICKEKGDSASCVSVDCEDTTDFPNNIHDPAMGGPRLNGESWCVRQAKVGVGNDLPGSRHYKYYCSYGEEKVEPCNEFREDVCFQILPNETIANNNGGVQKSVAECIPNEGAQCVSECNEGSSSEKKNCCEQYESCIWSDNAFCVPSIPPGYAFDDKFVQATPEYEAEAQCEIGNQECKSVWVKNWKFKWECKQNCHCTYQEWPEDMNDFCRSLGDCGAWYNLAGEFTDKGQKTNGGETKDLNIGSYKQKYPFSEIIIGGEQFSTIFYLGFAQTMDWEMYHLWRWEQQLLPIILWNILTDFNHYLTSFWAAGPMGWIFGIGDRKTKTHSFTCAPWQAPTRSDNCEQCSDLAPDGTCYESLCRSLGKNCELINGEDPIFAECISGSINDVAPPKITPWAELIQGQTDKFGVSYSYDVVSGNPGGYVINPDIDSLIPFNFGVQTNEPAQCRYDTELNTSGYYEMTHEFDQGSLLVKDHNFTLILPGNQDYDFYVRCVDFYDNGENDPPFLIKFSTKDEPDRQPPIILSTDPLSGSSVAYDINQTPVILYMNEPVETCRWSNQNVPFEQMNLNNSFLCGCDSGETNACTGTSPPQQGEELCNYLDENGLFVYDDFECVGLLEGIQPEQENTYFISCVDIEKNDGTGCNYFPSSYEYTLSGSSELEIISMEPENGTYYTSMFDLRVVTMGGADNGNAVCYYNGVEFFNTGGSTHVQPQNRTAGTYEYEISCEDIAQNTADDLMSITIYVNSYPPVVENLYSQNGNLYLITDEPSTCEYSVESSSFSIGNGFEMTGVLVKEHSLTFNEDVYYIKCYDSFMNIGSTITVYNGA